MPIATSMRLADREYSSQRLWRSRVCKYVSRGMCFVAGSSVPPTDGLVEHSPEQRLAPVPGADENPHPVGDGGEQEEHARDGIDARCPFRLHHLKHVPVASGALPRWLHAVQLDLHGLSGSSGPGERRPHGVQGEADEMQDAQPSVPPQVYLAADAPLGHELGPTPRPKPPRAAAAATVVEAAAPQIQTCRLLVYRGLLRLFLSFDCKLVLWVSDELQQERAVIVAKSRATVGRVVNRKTDVFRRRLLTRNVEVRKAELSHLRFTLKVLCMAYSTGSEHLDRLRYAVPPACGDRKPHTDQQP